MNDPTVSQADQTPRRLDWAAVEDDAASIFSIWVDQPELQWAKLAWSDLDKAGLTCCRDPLEETRVQMRLLALGTYYHTFCMVAWDERGNLLESWAQDLDLNPFRVAQLAGTDFLRAEDLDAEQLVEEAVTELVRREFRAVATALQSASDGDSLLFASLWLSRDERFSGRRPIPDDVLDDVLNDDVDEKGAGYVWVSDPYMLLS